MSVGSGDSGPTPSWYTDPGDPRFLRYWDGKQWTEHTAPNAASAAGRPGPPPRGGSNRVLWIVLAFVVGVPALLAILGVIAAVAIPVFMSQQMKAEDLAAKADVSTLGKEVATWYVDHEGGLPAVTVSGGEYSVDHVAVGAVSANVQLGGITGTRATDWCVWVTNPEGDLKDYQYSAQRGLAQGGC